MSAKLLSSFIFLIYSFSFLGILTPVTHAQSEKKTSRLYLPVTKNTTVLKEGSEQRLMIRDYLGSTKVISSEEENSSQNYLPYGNEVTSNKMQETNKSQTSNFNNQISDKGFTGHRDLSDSNIIHMAARFYNPQTGTFIQPDTVEGPNRYSYVKGNPVSLNDPSGHMGCSEDPWLAWFWRPIGVCSDGDDPQQAEGWEQEEGLGAVAELTQTVDDFSGNVGSMAQGIGDKLAGSGGSMNKGAIAMGVAGAMMAAPVGRAGNLTQRLLKEAADSGIEVRPMTAKESGMSLGLGHEGVSGGVDLVEAYTSGRMIAYRPGNLNAGIMAHELRHVNLDHSTVHADFADYMTNLLGTSHIAVGEETMPAAYRMTALISEVQAYRGEQNTLATYLQQYYSMMTRSDAAHYQGLYQAAELELLRHKVGLNGHVINMYNGGFTPNVIGELATVGGKYPGRAREVGLKMVEGRETYFGGFRSRSVTNYVPR